MEKFNSSLSNPDPRTQFCPSTPSREVLNRLSGEIIDAAMHVHSALGPGLLESTYQACLAYELQKRGFSVLTQVALPVVYESVKLDAGYRIDLLINDSLGVEIKSVEAIAPIHEAQLADLPEIKWKETWTTLELQRRPHAGRDSSES